MATSGKNKLFRVCKFGEGVPGTPRLTIVQFLLHNFFSVLSNSENGTLLAVWKSWESQPPGALGAYQCLYAGVVFTSIIQSWHAQFSTTSVWNSVGRRAHLQGNCTFALPPHALLTQFRATELDRHGRSTSHFTAYPLGKQTLSLALKSAVLLCSVCAITWTVHVVVTRAVGIPYVVFHWN
jgi:hypothetical protein